MFENNGSDLFNLVRLSIIADWLQVKDFLDTVLGKNVMVTPNSHIEP